MLRNYILILSLSDHLKLFDIYIKCHSIISVTFQDILDFLSKEFGDTDRIRQIADNVKKLKLSVSPEEIAKLAEDIKEALASLTGIDEILQETEERLNKANNLKERAEQAR